jgi:hypothetical protein
VKEKDQVMSLHHPHYHNHPDWQSIYQLQHYLPAKEKTSNQRHLIDGMLQYGLYLNLSGVRPNDAGSGNYWILYTTGRALEAANQSLRSRGDDITRDQLVSDLRKLFQTSRQQDNVYERFNNVQQVQHGKVRRITEVIVDLRMYQGRLGEGTISNYAFIQKLFSCMHTELRRQVEIQYSATDDLDEIIEAAERIDAVLRETGAYKEYRSKHDSTEKEPKGSTRNRSQNRSSLIKERQRTSKSGPTCYFLWRKRTHV